MKKIIKLMNKKNKYLSTNDKYFGLIKYNNFIPEINKPFFAVQLYATGSSISMRHGFTMNMVNFPRRITILDDNNKKYKQEFIEFDNSHREKLLPNNKYRIDSYYVVYHYEICPNEDFKSDINFKNQPILEFPWNTKNNNWIIAETMRDLDAKCLIFFKHFNFDTLNKKAKQYINKRKKKIDSLLKNKEK